MRRLLPALALIVLVASPAVHTQEKKAGHYLFAWTGDADGSTSIPNCNTGAESKLIARGIRSFRERLVVGMA